MSVGSGREQEHPWGQNQDWDLARVIESNFTFAEVCRGPAVKKLHAQMLNKLEMIDCRLHTLYAVDFLVCLFKGDRADSQSRGVRCFIIWVGDDDGLVFTIVSWMG